MFVGTDICVFRDGEWWYHAKGCHHTAYLDEAGTPNVPSGWTAQQLEQPTRSVPWHQQQTVTSTSAGRHSSRR